MTKYRFLEKINKSNKILPDWSRGKREDTDDQIRKKIGNNPLTLYTLKENISNFIPINLLIYKNE